MAPLLRWLNHGRTEQLQMWNEKHEERDGDPAQDGERDAADSENDGVGEKNGNEGLKTVPAKKDPD